MKILQYHAMPCIRTWKQAMVLNDLGHEVYLGQMYNSLQEMYNVDTSCYKETFFLSSIVALSRIMNYFDVVHCANEPDWTSCLAIAMAKDFDVKIVHDCHDWIVGRQRVSEDTLTNAVVANTMSDLVVYVGELQRDLVANVTGEAQAKSIVLYNYPLERYIPSETLPKKDTGKVKLVYAGAIWDKPNTHRYFYDEFHEFLKAGYEIYVYAPRIPELYNTLDRGYKEFHIMGHCKYENLMTEISQYDIGMLPFLKTPENAVHLDMGMPNKLFEYMAAGLPVICKKGLAEQEKFITEQDCGVMYDTPIEVQFNMKYLMDVKIDRFKYIFDNEVKEKLIPEYEKLSMNNEYSKIESENLLPYKNFMMDMEIYGTDECNIALFGRGHDKDLLFESWMADQIMEGEENEQTEQKSD